jgi:DNA-binding transcriptional MerR regulator
VVARQSGLTVSQLVGESQTPLSTIKFYLREGLLSPGDLRAAHRAFYGEAHVQRLRLIRVLRDVGHLPIPAIRDICRLLDGEGSRDWARVIAHVIDALGRREPVVHDSEAVGARREVLRLLATKGIGVRRNSRAVTDLASALVGLRRALGADVSAETFIPYLDAMCALAERDFEVNKHLVTSAASAAMGATYATVLWEPVLVLLRRVAHEHLASRVFEGRERRTRRRA